MSQLSEDAARAIAEGLWTNINLKNLRENILPTRARADLILRKGADHLVEEVALQEAVDEHNGGPASSPAAASD